MKKKVRTFCVALLIAFSLSAFSFMDWNDFETDQLKTLAGEDPAMIIPATMKINKRAFCNLAYGPSQLEKRHYPPYLAAVPEKQAEYEGGREALTQYLKENSKEAEARAMVQMNELPPFKLLFTVTKKGFIENVKLDGTSGYLSIDNTMIELITKAPGKWEPAENSKGEKVDQDLVVAFGLTGC